MQRWLSWVWNAHPIHWGCFCIWNRPGGRWEGACITISKPCLPGPLLWKLPPTMGPWGSGCQKQVALWFITTTVTLISAGGSQHMQTWKSWHPLWLPTLWIDQQVKVVDYFYTYFYLYISFHMFIWGFTRNKVISHVLSVWLAFQNPGRCYYPIVQMKSLVFQGWQMTHPQSETWETTELEYRPRYFFFQTPISFQNISLQVCVMCTYMWLYMYAQTYHFVQAYCIGIFKRWSWVWPSINPALWIHQLFLEWLEYARQCQTTASNTAWTIQASSPKCTDFRVAEIWLKPDLDCRGKSRRGKGEGRLRRCAF